LYIPWKRESEEFAFIAKTNTYTMKMFPLNDILILTLAPWYGEIFSLFCVPKFSFLSE